MRCGFQSMCTRRHMFAQFSILYTEVSNAKVTLGKSTFSRSDSAQLFVRLIGSTVKVIHTALAGQILAYLLHNRSSSAILTQQCIVGGNRLEFGVLRRQIKSRAWVVIGRDNVRSNERKMTLMLYKMQQERGDA